MRRSLDRAVNPICYEHVLAGSCCAEVRSFVRVCVRVCVRMSACASVQMTNHVGGELQLRVFLCVFVLMQMMYRWVYWGLNLLLI